MGMHLQSQYSKASQSGSQTGLHSDTFQGKKERDGEERERSAGLTGMVERFLPFSYRTLAASPKWARKKIAYYGDGSGCQAKPIAA